MGKVTKGEGLNILAVDDEPQITDLIRVILQNAGHSVDVLHDGGEALARLTELPGHYHLLITDHVMRKVSGLEFLVQLPMNVFKGRIIVLTGNLTPELDAKYRALGVDRIMRKPFNADELRQTVEELRPAPAK
jgi:two-component system chemotaxis response regulator CheY